jgi:hypothetical protein
VANGDDITVTQDNPTQGRITMKVVYFSNKNDNLDFEHPAEGEQCHIVGTISFTRREGTLINKALLPLPVRFPRIKPAEPPRLPAAPTPITQ